MSATLSRRAFLATGGAAFAGTAAIGWRLKPGTVAGGAAPVRAGGLAAGYERLCDDLAANWFTTSGTAATGGRPGILPTDGSGGPATGTTHGVTAVTRGGMWQGAQYVMFLRGDHRLRGSASPAARRIAQQLALLKASYPIDDATHGLGSDGSGDGTINVSDDAAWKMRMLTAIHDVTRDPSVLAAMRSAVIAINAKYRDVYAGGANRVANGPLPFSRYGMLYAIPGQDPNGQGRSSTYEVGTMLAALHVYGATRERPFLIYPATVYAAFKRTLQHPSGIYYQTLQLDPDRRFDGTAYLGQIERDRGARPTQNYTGFTIGGTVAMAVLAARLHRLTGEDGYRRDAVAIADGIATHYLQHGRIICDRDPWTGGCAFFDFAREVLTLPGVDPAGVVRRAIIATGAQILGTRRRVAGVAGGWGYSAEWSGNTEPSIAGGFVTWEAHGAAANGGRGGGQAGPQQIMTQTSSGIVVQAAAALARAAVA